MTFRMLAVRVVAVMVGAFALTLVVGLLSPSVAKAQSDDIFANFSNEPTTASRSAK